MDKVLENILNLMGRKSGSQRKFTTELDFCTSTVADWKSGKSKSYTKHLPKIADYFGVTVDFLLNGKTVDEEGNGITSVGTLKPVPILGTVRAGLPLYAEENFDGYESADIRMPDEYFYLRVSGDSMIGAGITDGSMVLCRRQDYADDGQIVACLVEGDRATLKRFRTKNHTVLLLPENPSYQPLILTHRDFESGDAKILGVAVEVKKKLV